MFPIHVLAHLSTFGRRLFTSSRDWLKQRALIAKGRLKELLDERGLRIEIKATTIRRSIVAAL